MKWRRRTFEVQMQLGPLAVDGFAAGNFGIRDVGRYRPSWSVTHLPTGLRLTPGNAGFANLDIAKTFAERMASLTDWGSLDAKVEDRALEGKMVTIWNELIALDTVKMFEKHYGPAHRRLG